MAFQFSLATVLRVRGIVEEREERVLQQILYELAQASENLAGNAADIAGSDASRRTDILKSFIGLNIHASYGEVEELKERRANLKGQIAMLEEKRDNQLIVYESARRNREMLTDMCEEKRGIYDADAARREQKTLDDNYIARRGRI